VSPAPDNASMRRLLRPIGWTVWQAVLEQAVDTDGVLVAAVSVRSLADELGLARDTVAAAFRRLTAHGLIERQPQPRHDSRFSPGHYALHPTTPALPPTIPTPSPAPRPTSSATTPPTTPTGPTLPTATPTDSPSAAATSATPTAPSQLSLPDLQPTAPTPPLLLRRTCISDAGQTRGTGAAPC
jgi:hypothetical protein